jgi:hypothetical protein
MSRGVCNRRCNARSRRTSVWSHRGVYGIGGVMYGVGGEVYGVRRGVSGLTGGG